MQWSSVRGTFVHCGGTLGQIMGSSKQRSVKLLEESFGESVHGGSTGFYRALHSLGQYRIITGRRKA